MGATRSVASKTGEMRNSEQEQSRSVDYGWVTLQFVTVHN